VVSLGIASITYISYQSSSTLVETEIRQKIKQLNFLLNHHVEQFFEHLMIEFVELSEDPSLTAILLNYMSSMQSNSVKTLLSELVTNEYNIYSVALLESTGYVKVSSYSKEEGLNYQHYAFFQQALDQQSVIFSDPLYHTSFETEGFFMAKAIELNQQTIGVLTIFIDLATLSKLFTEIVDLGDLGYAFILGHEGQFIAHPDPHLYLKNVKQFSFGHQMLQVRNDFFEYVYKDLITISYLSELKNTNWLIGIRLDKTHAFDNLAAIRDEMIMIGCLVIIMIGLLLLYSTHHILSSLLKIRTHLMSLAAGNPLAETVIDYQGHDEIKDLVHTVQVLKQSMYETIEMANAIAEGDYEYVVNVRSTQDQINQAIANMTANLRCMSQQTQAQDWLKTGQTELANRMRGEKSVQELSAVVIHFLADYLNAEVGAFYLFNDDGSKTYLERSATHACVLTDEMPRRFTAQAGLLGQLLTEKKPIVIQEAPPDYLQVKSGLGHSQPYQVLLMPILYENQLKGALELASLRSFSELQYTFLNTVLPSIAITLHSAQAREHTQQLLIQMQTQTEELQTQAEELRVQQEELQEVNEELQSRKRR
jgi:hypothetical protein